MTALCIRPATAGDAASISALVLSLTTVFFDDPSADLPPAVAASLSPEGCRERIVSTDYHSGVAIESGQLLGYASVFERRHLYHLFVSPEAQGRGIGRALWQCVLQDCAPGDVTVRSSRVAVPVYRRFGFELDGEPETRQGVTYQPLVLRRSPETPPS